MTARARKALDTLAFFAVAVVLVWVFMLDWVEINRWLGS